MRLIVLTVVAAAVIGSLAGGTFRDFPAVKIRGAWLALAGVVLQFIPRRRNGRDRPALRLVRRPDRRSRSSTSGHPASR